MPYALELFFDAQADRLVRDCWSRMAQAGAGEDMQEIGATPHVALGVWEDVDEDHLQAAVDAIATQCDDLTLRFSAVAIWPHTGTLFLAPAPSARLLSIHEHLCELMQDADSQMQRYYQFGELFPHCTLGQRIASDDLGRALAIGTEMKLPITATVTHVTAVRFRPVEVIHQQAIT